MEISLQVNKQVHVSFSLAEVIIITVSVSPSLHYIHYLHYPTTFVRGRCLIDEYVAHSFWRKTIIIMTCTDHQRRRRMGRWPAIKEAR